MNFQLNFQALMMSCWTGAQVTGEWTAETARRWFFAASWRN